MRDDEELRSRLAKLQSTPSRSDIQGSTSHVQDQKSLRERLNALSHNQVTSSEGEYSSRLSRLLSEREHEPSADDLAARLTRLGGSLTSTTQLPSPHEVPPGEAEDVEDLDELLEDIIEALPSGQQIEADVERGEMAPRTSEIDPKLLDQKLQDLDGMAAALLAEVAGNTSLDTKMPAQEEIQRAGMESFLGGSKEAVDGKMEAAGGMGDEEQRLFDMVNDEVRVEGHGITSPPPNQSSEKADELWLPVAPTAPPVRRPRNTGAGAARSTLSAEIIAEQAMDEARLGLSSGTGKGNRGGRIDGPRGIGGEEDGEIWCSICPDDVTLRCHESEEESEVDNAEPELFCGPSFRETHQEDPELRSRRPHSALTSKLRKGGGKSPAKKSGNFFGKWRR